MFFLMAAQAALSASTSTALRAPRLTASSDSAPVPANRSSTRASSTSQRMMLNSDSRT